MKRESIGLKRPDTRQYHSLRDYLMATPRRRSSWGLSTDTSGRLGAEELEI